jgi:hypothetical protein
MTQTETTPMTTLLHQRIAAATLASVLLLPLCPRNRALQVLTEMKLPDREAITYINGSSITPGTTAFSTLPSHREESQNIAACLRELTNLSVSILAIASDVTRQAYYGWLDNQSMSSERVARLEKLRRTFEVVAGTVGTGEPLKAWLHHESELGPPLQLLREGRDDVAIGLTFSRPANRVQTLRGRVAQSVRTRGDNTRRRSAAYRQYSIVATEDLNLASDLIEAGDILGQIRIE